MIKSIKHKGLKRLWTKGDASKLPVAQLNRIENILEVLDGAEKKDDMNLPGYYMHELKGDLKNCYSVRVTGNWRITYRFEDGHAYDVNHTDYH